MACQVGITTDPDRRKEEWKREYPYLRDWTIIAKYLTKSAAQARENEEAERRGCASSPGGDDPEAATWYGYCFRH